MSVAPRERVGKLSRMVPWFGTAFALMTVAATMKRKGLVRGALDIALDATPVLGGVKMIAEGLRGRDFIADLPAMPPPV